MRNLRRGLITKGNGRISDEMDLQSRGSIPGLSLAFAVTELFERRIEAIFRPKRG